MGEARVSIFVEHLCTATRSDEVIAVADTGATLVDPVRRRLVRTDFLLF